MQTSLPSALASSVGSPNLGEHFGEPNLGEDFFGGVPVGGGGYVDSDERSEKNKIFRLFRVK